MKELILLYFIWRNKDNLINITNYPSVYDKYEYPHIYIIM